MKRLNVSNRVGAAALLACTAVFAVSGPAQAYDWQGGKWARNKIPVAYSVANSLSTDVPDRQALEAIQIGYQAWTQPCSYMVWEYQGRTPNTDWGNGDGINVSSWREDEWDQPEVVLGITSTITNFQGEIEDADIKFNGRDHSWAAFGDAPGFDERVDIASVAAHEAGHALGLGHSAVEGATMWPSTGPGDITNRSLAADDIQGVCEVYPSGGDIPDPGTDPPPPQGDVQFGGDCSGALCAHGLFCASDGREEYCSRNCEPVDNDCGEGYYCAPLAGGGGACARGVDPGSNLGNFGEECGQSRSCAPGLTCVNDDNKFYCTGPCLQDACPEGYFCAELQGGGSICARGEQGGGGGALGQPCDQRGLCQRGLFCLNDELHTDPMTGDPVPYCTPSCETDACPAGFRCVDVPPLGKACQLVPSAGDKKVGDECWVDPEHPDHAPSCGADLICVGYLLENDMVVTKGTCSKNCDANDCCPDGWGCQTLTPHIGQCIEGRSDDEAFACATGGGTGGTGGGTGGTSGGSGGTSGGSGDAGVSDGAITTIDGAIGGNGAGGGGGGGCSVSDRGAPALPALLLLAAPLAATRLRRRR